MEFDSPDAAKEFPGLYKAESGKANDSLEYTDDGEKKKNKKDKKDSKKDKGYSALAADSSQDEDEMLDPKSPGKGMKIKAFSKLSGKRKDKDKKSEKSAEKEQKKAEKEAKEKRKSEEKERKSLEKELNSTPGPSAPRPQVPFSGVHHIRSNSHSHSASLTPQSSIDLGTPVKRNTIPISSEISAKESTPPKPPKEKSAGFNVFLNAPAPILSKLKDRDKVSSKDKESKKEHKDKEKKHKDKSEKTPKKDREHKEKEKKEHSHPSGIAKVKLKLMRSKNSLEDPGDVPHVTSHQFPEDPDALVKEIKKHEGLLEQAHTQLKSSKKISKKQEEQLWELQRTLTQLKRKLRSINALSSATSYHVHAHPLAIDRTHSELPLSSPVSHPIFKKCDSIDSHGGKKLTVHEQKAAIMERRVTKESEATAPPAPPTSNPIEIPKIPMPPSKNSHKIENSVATSPPSLPTSPPQSVVEDVVDSVIAEARSPTAAETVTNVPEKAPLPLSPPRPSIDTVAQVHRSSLSDDRPDSEEIPDAGPEEPVENEQEQSNEYMNSQASISNDSQDSKENMEAVMDDANKLIGSMHEELMFEDSVDVDVPVQRTLRSSDQLNASTDPQNRQEDSDSELDPESNLPTDEPCPDPFSMPVFDTTEYLSIENEALALFTEQVKDDMKREQDDLEEILKKLPIKAQTNEGTSSGKNNSQNDISDLVEVWTQLKSENEILWDNVNRLRFAVAACKVDEFRLQTRLNYIESRTSALSPVTTTTPLQTEG